MRKDKLSSFQAKKQKLLKIKELISTYDKIKPSEETLKLKVCEKDSLIKPERDLTPIEAKMMETLKQIWEIVKDE